MSKEFLWWRDGVIYQIYPRSFADSDGDGIGDIPGLIAKLDYLADLGIDAIWLSPINPSPDKDFGYDVSDYKDIDAKYGSLQDYDLLIKEAHKRGIRIIMDLVLNHSSDQHPWFLESRRSKESDYRDWYIWRDPKGKNQPPNNWQSIFGGKAWEYDEVTGQYYYHMFLPEQPDVNWRNPEVRKAILEDVPYPIRGAYMMCCNPMLSYADSRLTYEAFMKLDFLAVAEIFMTPTAAMADVVLPAATQFEFNDIGHIGIGHGYILARPKVVEPPDECWPDIKIMNELGKLMTPKELWKENFDEFAEDVVKPAGLTYAQFCEKGYLKGPERFKKYEEKGFGTPTQKVELRLSTAEKFKLSPLPVYKGLPEAEDPAYPLVLTSAKSRYYLHSSYRWIEKLRKLNPDPRLEIHPETAGKFGIAEGDKVLIETPYGKITQVAYFSDALDARVLCAAHGWWFPEGDPETQYDWQTSNFNMLTSVGKLGKEYGTPNLKGLPCRVSKK